MMQQISRHTVDMDLVHKQLDMRARVLAATLNGVKRDPSLLNQLALTAEAYAGYLSIIDPASPGLCRTLHIGLDAIAGIFALSCGQGQVELSLANEPVTLPATAITSISHPANWCDGFYLAAICRDTARLDRLCTVPVDVLRRSSTQGNEYLYLYIDALQGYYHRDADTPSRLLAALDATDPDRFQFFDQDWVLDMVVPQIDLLYRLILREGAMFNEALRKALLRHRVYWSRDTRRQQDPRGYLAFGPLAFASFAHDAGLAVQVESDYLPPGLIEGDCR